MARVTIQKYDVNTSRYLGQLTVNVNYEGYVTVSHRGYSSQDIYVTPSMGSASVHLTPRFGIL